MAYAMASHVSCVMAGMCKADARREREGESKSERERESARASEREVGMRSV